MANRKQSARARSGSSGEGRSRGSGLRSAGRSRAAGRSRSARASQAEIERLRARMDETNRDLLRRIESRVALARRIGRAKAVLGWPGADPRREREMLARLLAAADGSVSRVELARVFRALFAVSRRAVERDRALASAAGKGRRRSKARRG